MGGNDNCTKSDCNKLDDIPQNGGKCFSILDCTNLRNIMDKILPADLEMFGNTLMGVKLKVDQGNYETMKGFELNKDLPDAVEVLRKGASPPLKKS